MGRLLQGPLMARCADSIMYESSPQNNGRWFLTQRMYTLYTLLRRGQISHWLCANSNYPVNFPAGFIFRAYGTSNLIAFEFSTLASFQGRFLTLGP